MTNSAWSAALYNTVGDDFYSWRSLVDKLPDSLRDVYYWPEYASLWEGETGERTSLFFFGDDDNFILNVFARRPIKDLGFAAQLPAGERERLCDIATPYGYGGPVLVAGDAGVREKLWREAETAYLALCREEGIVAEFIRLHPLVENHRFFLEDDGLCRKNYTVWIDLQQAPDEILENVRRDHRKSIRRAKRNGVEVVRTEEREDLETFARLYGMTMDRLDALESYRYSPDFFAGLYDLLGPGVSLFKAEWEGQVASAHLVIHSGDYIHNFFSGSDPDLWHTRGDVLITYEIALWAREQGYRKFDLGGGHASEEDNLLSYKSGFSPLKSPYYMFRRVCDEGEYARLCDFHAQYQTGVDNENLDPVLRNYFPAYRV